MRSKLSTATTETTKCYFKNKFQLCISLFISVQTSMEECGQAPRAQAREGPTLHRGWPFLLPIPRGSGRGLLQS